MTTPATPRCSFGLLSAISALGGKHRLDERSPLTDYLTQALGKPVSEGKTTITMTTTAATRAGDEAETLRIALLNALEDEAGTKSVYFHGTLSFREGRSVRCLLMGENYVWCAYQYEYFARAIPEAFGYITGYTDRGAVIVTTEAGEYICEFKAPERLATFYA